MTTVANLIDRTFRQYLEPPDAQPASTRLDGALDISQTTVTLQTFDIPEDEALMRGGSLIEADSELMRVVDYDVDSHVATVERDYLATTAAIHADNAQVKLNPPFARLDVFNAVRDNISGLYPQLWSVRTAILANVGVDVYPLPDDLAVEVIEAQLDGGGATVAVEARIVDYHQLTGGRALVTNGVTGLNIWLRYRRRFGVATTEADLLDELGLDEVWQQVVAVGVAADLLAGRDIPAQYVEWVGSTLQAENIPVTTRAQISVGLVRYRELLIERMGNEMKAESSSKPRVHMNDPFAVVS